MREYQYDVFLSFTGADREKKDAIKARLSELGLSYYDSDLYCKGQFRQDFCEALDQSRVYLLILSDHLRNDPNMTGKGTFSEVRRECDLACQLEASGQLNMVILCLSAFFRYEQPFHDYNDEIGWFFYTHTRGFSYVTGEVDAEGALTAKCLNEVAVRCRSFVEQRNAGKPVPSQKPKLEIAEERLPERVVFKGREREILTALDAFAEGKQVVVLSGIGGIGKTALATEIARQCEEQGFLRCPQIVHVQELAGVRGGLHTLTSSVSYDKSVYDSLSTLAERDKFERKLGALTALPETVLLVVDNYNALGDRDVKEVLTKLKCRMLITTRAQIHADAKSVSVIKLDCLAEEQAHELFCEISEREVSDADFREIYQFVGGHTITLCIMARMLRVHGMQISQLLSEMVRLDTMDAKVDFRHNDYDAADTVLGHLSNLFGISNFDDGCKRVLRSMCILGDGTISVVDLMRVLGLKNRNEINTLVASGWLELQKQGEGERLYLHPILSRLMAITLVPTEENVGEMVTYLSEDAGARREGLSYADAALLGDRLFYACYVLAGGNNRLSVSLWKRFTQVNYLLGDAEDVTKKVEALTARLSDKREIARITAYGDMVTIEQYPTRVEVLDKYLADLEENAHDYKWVLRCLSVTIGQVYGVPKYRPFLCRALESALSAAMRRKDDFAVCDLLIYFVDLNENVSRKLKQIKAYVRERKREGAQSGDLTYLEFLTMAYGFLGPNAGVENVLHKAKGMITEGFNSPVRLALKTLLLHPLAILKVGRIIARVQSKPVEACEGLECVLRMHIESVGEDALDANTFINAAVRLHRERWEREHTLASTVDALEGVLRVLLSLPESIVHKHAQALTENLDMEHLTVSALSNLQVAALINRSYRNPEAVAQSRQVLQAVSRLRPEGHSDVIDALISHGDVCLLFDESKEGMRAYGEAWSMLIKKDTESNRMVELAQKMLYTPALAGSCAPETMHDWVLKIATRDLAPPADDYYALLYAYSQRLLAQAEGKRKRVSYDSPLFAELWNIAEKALSIRGVKRIAQNTIVLMLENAIAKMRAARAYTHMERPTQVLTQFAKWSSIRSVRRSASIRLSYAEAIRAYKQDRPEAERLLNHTVHLCVRWNTLIDYAASAMYYRMLELHGKLEDTGDPFAGFVKGKKNLAFLYALRERTEKERGIQVVPYLRVGAKMMLSDNYGITRKQFSRLRSEEDFYNLVFRKMLMR